ncbi:FecR protein [Pedobacter terrae]|uniref:FecR protein n=1 Tax=Pedobacter terrae TaxID=405671 RepID=A0A1G8BTI8_9SPHI|nr:FecR family protein [Pedobacter terrae]SDH36414.1 FecR protein [Pedobacter terrae]
MNNTRIHELLKLYLDDSASDLEQSELWDYVNNPFYDAELKHLIGQAFDQQVDGVELTEQEQQNFLDFIYAIDKPVTRRFIKSWPLLTGIAAAIALVVLGVFFFNYRNNGHAYSEVLAAQNRIPGTFDATLTLANGKKIKLSDATNGEIAKEAGISVTKTADGQLVYEIKGKTGAAENINTLSTAKGETYILTLPDKSKVWLNAASIITYSTTFREHGVRKVKLEGEAYFEISKDKTHPFIVQTAKQEVEVLGTHFNINSYHDEPATATTLLEGSVKVKAGKVYKVIKPGQQAINNQGSIAVQQVDVDNVLDWKNGDFYLNHIAFKTAMRKIARWYDMEVIYDDTVPDNMESGGWISRDKPLSSVLKSIESSGLVKFKVVGRKIYVTE